MPDLPDARGRVPMHPQAETVVAARSARPATDLAGMRDRYVWSAREFGLPPADLECVADIKIPRDDGGNVPARVYWPRPSNDARGCIVWFHGGAWVLGALDGVDPLAGAIAEASGARVVAVDYRLAPEHPFPAALHDADAALAWARNAGAEQLGHTPTRVIVGGDSAGGNIATVAARRSRDAGAEPPLIAQLLAYPVTDASMSTPSYREPAPTINEEAMRTCWELYLGGASPDANDPDMSPMAADLAGLSPTLIVLAGHDVLYDDGHAYAKALRSADVEVDVAEFLDLPHGFLDWSGAIEPGVDAVLRLGAFGRERLLAQSGGA